MKIVVAVKAVAALDDEFELLDDGAAVDPDFLEWDLNEWDAFSLEAALAAARSRRRGRGRRGHRRRRGRRGGAAELPGQGRRPRRARSGTTRSRARTRWPWRGARRRRRARVRRISCSAACSPRMPSTARPGSRSPGCLDLPHVAVVKRLDYDAASATATVERELEGGLVEVLRVRTPALLTIQTGINQPRYATLRAIKQAREKPLAVEDARRARARRARRSRRPPDRGGASSRSPTAAPAPRCSTARRPRWRRGSSRSSGSGWLMAGVLVVAEARRGELREVSLELIAAALAVKDAAGGRVAVALIDAEPQPLRAGASADGRRRGAARSPRPRRALRGARRRARARGADRRRAARRSCCWATRSTRSGFAPAVAARAGLGFASDVTALAGTAARSRGAAPTATSCSPSSSSRARRARC